MVASHLKRGPLKARFIALLLTVVAGRVTAQQRDQRIPDGKALGITVDRFRILEYDERYTTVTFHLTQLNAGGLSPDFAFGIFPSLLRAYTVVTTLDAGLGYNISLPRVTIIPHIGASSFFALGLGGSAALVGYHAGVSVLINFSTTNAIRLDVTRREYFHHGDFPESSLTLGIGISSVQPRHAQE